MTSIAPSSALPPPEPLRPAASSEGASEPVEARPVEARVIRRDTAAISEEAQALLAAEQTRAPDD